MATESGFRRFHLFTLRLALAIAIAVIGINFYASYRLRLNQGEEVLLSSVDGSLRSRLNGATLSASRMRAVVSRRINAINLPLFAAFIDRAGRIGGGVNVTPALHKSLADSPVPPGSVNQFIERSTLVMLPIPLGDQGRLAVFGFSKWKIVDAVLPVTYYTAGFLMLALLAYFITVGYRFRIDIELPLRHFVERRLSHNIQNIVLDMPYLHEEPASLSFLPDTLRQDAEKMFDILDVWAQHKANLDQVISLAIMEVNRGELIRNLFKVAASEFPLRGYAVLGVNNSLNRLEPIGASADTRTDEELLGDPARCLVYRSGTQLTQSPGKVICHRCIASDSYVICRPLTAGSQQIGICMVELDPKRLETHWPFVAHTEEKLRMVDSFLAPYTDLASLSLSSINLLEAYKNQAITDALTGLYNRRYLIEYLGNLLNLARRNDTPFSVFMIDLDDFKRLNDEYGHKTGDMVLRQVTRTMAHAIRESDVIGRVGGEEFVVALPDTDQENACRLAERLRKAVAEIDWSQHELGHLPPVTISLGVAQFPQHGHSHYQLTNAADIALYRAKRAGKNRVACYDAEPPTD